MSVSGIASHSVVAYNMQQAQNQRVKMQQEFQQLGQDLQSGNLPAAQSDLSTLQQLTPQSDSTSSTQSSNPITQEFSQLAQDLKSGNLSSAQADYSKLQQNLQSEGTRAHHSHHHHNGGGSSAASEVNQLFQQLGQELQAGSLSTAQQTYATLQQDFQLNQTSGLFSGQKSPTTTGISATA